MFNIAVGLSRQPRKFLQYNFVRQIIQIKSCITFRLTSPCASICSVCVQILLAVMRCNFYGNNADGSSHIFKKINNKILIYLIRKQSPDWAGINSTMIIIIITTIIRIIMILRYVISDASRRTRQTNTNSDVTFRNVKWDPSARLHAYY